MDIPPAERDRYLGPQHKPSPPATPSPRTPHTRNPREDPRCSPLVSPEAMDEVLRRPQNGHAPPENRGSPQTTALRERGPPPPQNTNLPPRRRCPSSAAFLGPSQSHGSPAAQNPPAPRVPTTRRSDRRTERHRRARQPAHTPNTGHRRPPNPTPHAERKVPGRTARVQRDPPTTSGAVPRRYPSQPQNPRVHRAPPHPHRPPRHATDRQTPPPPRHNPPRPRRPPTRAHPPALTPPRRTDAASENVGCRPIPRIPKKGFEPPRRANDDTDPEPHKHKTPTNKQSSPTPAVQQRRRNETARTEEKRRTE